MRDVVVIGAGVGGLHCAARLAGAGMSVLVAERSRHAGGTSALFRRGGYGFPMGPLAFSFPAMVKGYLEDLGSREEISFRRNHFQLLSPSLDIVYSQGLEELALELKERFPEEEAVGPFLADLARTARLIARSPGVVPPELRRQSQVPAAKVLGGLFRSEVLKNLLGSMGTTPPSMSMLNLRLMWNAMSEVGIWYPSCGFEGLHRILVDALAGSGGELRLGDGVERILVDGERVRGVRLDSGEEVAARWVVSNADYKRTFLDLVGRRALPAEVRRRIEGRDYSTSEICVYLGVDPAKVDFSAMRSTHLFYQRGEASEGPEEFEGREIEICRWSDNAPGQTPPGRASLVLRVDFPYDLFAPYRGPGGGRGEGYGAYKERLARRLVAAAEGALPGLSSAVEVMEAATPLTYEERGRRHRGSIAGWSWRAGGGGEGLLVRTPWRNLLMAGVYASTELFMGGVPTAFFTGAVAADLVAESGRPGGRPARRRGGEA